MKIAFNLLLVCGLLSPLNATNASDDLQLLSLFDVNGFVAGFLIPFQVRGGLALQGQISSSSVETTNAVDCRVMNDPFIPLILHMKCASATDATLHVNFEVGEKVYPLTYGPIHVVKPAGIQLGGGDDRGGSDGYQLFTDRCYRCHQSGGSAPVLSGHPSADYIYNKLHNSESMNRDVRLTSLTMEQINAIAAYLGTL